MYLVPLRSPLGNICNYT